MKLPLTFALLAASAAAYAQTPAVPMLVTPEEAARPEATPRVMRGLFPGPTIRLTVPSEVAASRPLRSPLRLRIEFEPRNQSPIDPSSVRLTYLKRPLVDVTPRLGASISARGIDLPGIGLPPGRHSFQVSAVDSKGNRGVANYTFTVAP